jgi:hypothetical protein
MSKKPKIKLPDPDTEEGRARMATMGVKNYPYYAGAWKIVDEPRVIFEVVILRAPPHEFRYGGKTRIGIPESIVGQPKLEERWIQMELGGKMVKLKSWRPWILPEFRGKRLLQ